MKKKPSLTRITVSNDTYGDSACFCIGDSGDFLQWASRRFKANLEIEEMTLGKFWKLQGLTGGFEYLIWMPAFKWSVQEQTILAHELCHITHQILATRGVDGGEGVGEAFAYLYSFFFREFWSTLKDLYKKKKLYKLYKP